MSIITVVVGWNDPLFALTLLHHIFTINGYSDDIIKAGSKL